MCGDEVITILFLPVEAGGESECVKSVLEVCADAFDACFGVSAGVDVDDGFEVVEVFVHVFLGLFYIVVVWHFVPPDVYVKGRRVLRMRRARTSEHPHAGHPSSGHPPGATLAVARPSHTFVGHPGRRKRPHPTPHHSRPYAVWEGHITPSSLNFSIS